MAVSPVAPLLRLTVMSPPRKATPAAGDVTATQTSATLVAAGSLKVYAAISKPTTIGSTTVTETVPPSDTSP